MHRRALLFAFPAAALVAGATYAYWWKPDLPDGSANLSVTEAHAALQTGEIWLVDIRRPEEWAATGVVPGALTLDMRRSDFVEALQVATASAPDRPVALICARGVRSRRLTTALTEAGITGLIDVPEGMLGSQAGPGWISAGLPVTEPS